METSLSENHKTVASLIHLSTFSKYFIPFGNFIAPLILWTVNKEKPFVNEHGKEAINFQLSILLYTLVIGLICIPFFAFFAIDFVELVEVIEDNVHHVSVQNIENLSGFITLFMVVAVLLFGIFVFELYAVINATIHANRGEFYKYPLSIPFIKINSEKNSEENQSENEHTS